MEGFIILILILAGAVGYAMYSRGKRAGFTANDNSFSQAGVTIHFAEQKAIIDGKTYDIGAITNIRTEPPPRGQRMAYDCVISLSDFNKPEKRIRFAGADAANKFMQRLCTAIEKAGGGTFRYH